MSENDAVSRRIAPHSMPRRRLDPALHGRRVEVVSVAPLLADGSLSELIRPPG
ncbi:hypothetical protein [Defluviimonas sp. WL0075]|uniref:Uncharacterized protein n=1 Tax=Albidovulum sediminicola TaxID=2984331 RepID=A0ABT2Z1R6_9RHOB|nr:hypothetical protein [Defluviimonas sp. WL0075]MCV2865064.1 hypothetical protein [Defluviimonas sp. WL0075]